MDSAFENYHELNFSFEIDYLCRAPIPSSREGFGLIMKKVLIITYYWPPSGGAGVQRWLKFAKYLPEFGWEPIILTVDPRYASYPQRDESLTTEIDPNCRVFTTRSFELYNVYKFISGKKEVPYGGFANESKEGLFQKVSKFLRGNFLIPDPRRGWNTYALKKALELIRKFNIETVITTSPPHSTQLIGLKLKQLININWIADLRDPWTDIYYYNQFKHTPLARNIDLKYERKMVENADLMITVSEDFKRLFVEKTRQHVAGKIMVIPNGFDEEDFAVRPVSLESKKVLTYIGTISEAYDITGLIGTLYGLSEQLKTELIVRFVGKVPPSVEQKFISTGLKIEFTGFVDHSKSVEFLMLSDLLLLIIPNVKNNGGIIPGKFFEYLAAQKPILAIGPTESDLDQIIKDTNCGQMFDYPDSEGMSRFIQANLNHPVSESNNEKAGQYSRKQLTRKIAQLLNNLKVKA